MINLVMTYLTYFREIYISKSILEDGSDMVITIIFHLLKEFLQDHKKFPKNLHLNLGKVLLRNVSALSKKISIINPFSSFQF